MNFPGIDGFLKKYQAQAKDAGIDPLGFYQPPFAYAAMQVLEQAIKATGSLDDDKLAEYIHANAFNTIVGEIQLQRARRMGDRAHDHGAVPERARQRARSVHDRPQAGHLVSAAIQGRRAARRRSRNSAKYSPSHADHRRRLRAKSSAPFTIEQARSDRSAAGRGAGQDRRQRHVPDRPARPRRLLQHALPAVFGHEGAGVVAGGRQRRRRGFAPGDHVVISFPWCGTCAELPPRHGIALP